MIAPTNAPRFSVGEAVRFGWGVTRRNFGFFVVMVIVTTIVRQTLNRLSDRHTNAVIRALATDEGLRRAVEEHGDTQYQSRLFRPVLAAAVRAGVRDLRLAPTVLAALGAAMLSLWSDGAPRAQMSRS